MGQDKQHGSDQGARYEKGRGPYFSQIPLELLRDPDKDAYVVAVFAAVFAVAWFSKKREASVPDSQLAKLAGCSDRQVRRSREWLRDHGWLEWEQKAGFPNVYKVHLSTPDSQAGVGSDSQAEVDAPDSQADGSASQAEGSASQSGVQDPDDIGTRARVEREKEKARARGRDAEAAPGGAPKDDHWTPASEAPPADLEVNGEEVRDAGPRRELKPLWDDAWGRMRDGVQRVRYRFDGGLALDFLIEMEGRGAASHSQRSVVAHWIPASEWPDVAQWAAVVARVSRELFKANGLSPKLWRQMPAGEYPRPGRATRWAET